MAIYAISDLHLPLGVKKPMNIFGKAWDNYIERLEYNWNAKIKPCDTVILPGDLSWATYLNESYEDFKFINALYGKKIILKVRRLIQESYNLDTSQGVVLHIIRILMVSTQIIFA